jgi:hypothetical protein
MNVEIGTEAAQFLLWEYIKKLYFRWSADKKKEMQCGICKNGFIPKIILFSAARRVGSAENFRS